jgi:uncharacterized repeat protein (TIGR03803 family)
MTYGGGAGGCGTIFEINIDGNEYEVLYSFSGDTSDGANPSGSLTLLGPTLYGITSAGGAVGRGTIFEINTDGNGYKVLYNLGDGAIDGIYFKGSLTLSGPTLYGMAYQGGANGYGVIFRINTDGNGYDVLYSFTAGNDGANPSGSLTLSGSTLYGMAYASGAKNCGTIFQINTEDNDFQVLHSFNGFDGAGPKGSLTLSGSTLYGMTTIGGAQGTKSYGTIFQMSTDGSGFKVLHSFSSTDGAAPEGSLILSGSTLYGMTSVGGADKLGTIFSLTATVVPGAPTNVTATAGNAQAKVSFRAPASNGGSPITSYTVTSSAGQTAKGPKSPITVKGLKNGTPYTFTVTATNKIGTSQASNPSDSVTPVK